ncbi:hypothetical protein, partial [Arthrobacter sp.]|uniref:hypothetical protein n=1 Tax=Arthrobacter sp. TaxID=1667 RepID=UPI0033929F82
MHETLDAPSKQPIRLTIHGDNVVECDRALSHLEEALGFNADWVPRSDPRKPTFAGFCRPTGHPVEVTLLPGHGRWGFDIPRALMGLGSTIRENADAVITITDGNSERILLAMEFCGALPAGNNAWQRHGRAFSFGQAGIPYLIYSEVGGQELNADRTEKASRLPNPAVPYSLVLFSRQTKVAVLPVYEAAPSATETARKMFLPAMGKQAGIEFLRDIVLGSEPAGAVRELERRALHMAKLITSQRRKVDGYSAEQWTELLVSTGSPFEYHLGRGRTWTRKAGDKVKSTPTARLLQANLNIFGPISVGSDGLPILLIDGNKKASFSRLLSQLYDSATAGALHKWLEKDPGPVAIVLVTGFKPAGGDSRPDRGLVPLARMLLGPSARILTLIWGPARPSLLRQIQSSPQAAAASNGLLQAVFS